MASHSLPLVWERHIGIRAGLSLAPISSAASRTDQTTIGDLDLACNSDGFMKKLRSLQEDYARRSRLGDQRSSLQKLDNYTLEIRLFMMELMIDQYRRALDLDSRNSEEIYRSFNQNLEEIHRIQRSMFDADDGVLDDDIDRDRQDLDDDGDQVRQDLDSEVDLCSVDSDPWQEQIEGGVPHFAGDEGGGPKLERLGDGISLAYNVFNETPHSIHAAIDHLDRTRRPTQSISFNEDIKKWPDDGCNALVGYNLYAKSARQVFDQTPDWPGDCSYKGMFDPGGSERDRRNPNLFFILEFAAAAFQYDSSGDRYINSNLRSIPRPLHQRSQIHSDVKFDSLLQAMKESEAWVFDPGGLALNHLKGSFSAAIDIWSTTAHARAPPESNPRAIATIPPAHPCELFQSPMKRILNEAFGTCSSQSDLHKVKIQSYTCSACAHPQISAHPFINTGVELIPDPTRFASKSASARKSLDPSAESQVQSMEKYQEIFFFLPA